MEKDQFTKKMEELKTPDTGNIHHYRDLKLMLVSAKKSGTIGFWFIVVPCYFLFCVFMKYYFHVNLHLFDVFIEMISDLDKTRGMKFISPIVLVVLPLAGIVLNALSILHFQYEKSWKEVRITVRLRWINILIILLSGLLVCVFILYALVENFHHAQFPAYQ